MYFLSFLFLWVTTAWENGTMAGSGRRRIRLANIHATRCSETTSFISSPTRNFQSVMTNCEASQGQSTQQFMEDIAVATFAHDFGINA